jgi:tRNA(adenine34) deaminase
MNHRFYLEEALKDAIKAGQEGQVPIGALVVNRLGEIIGRAYNQVNRLSDRTAHAEMLAIREAISRHSSNGTENWIVYTTLEPCPMCLGTIIMCNIGTVVWASPDIHINTHKILTALPYLRTRKLTTVMSPYSDLEQKCAELHNQYWISIGRADVIEPIT